VSRRVAGARSAFRAGFPRVAGLALLLVALPALRPERTAGQAANGRGPGEAQGAGGDRLRALVDEALSVRTPTRSEAEYRRASLAYSRVLGDLRALDTTRLDFDDRIDRELAIAHVRTRLFEIDSIALYRVNPVSYFALGQTDRLFVRPGAIADPGVRAAVAELQRLPEILANGKRNLTRPARTWTENALYQAYYARTLLEQYVPTAMVDDAALRQELLAAARTALAAVADFEAWLRDELLPRSDRSPAWKPREIEFYQFVHEQLDEFGVDEMLRIAEAEDRAIRSAMEALADSIHPSGDLRTVWEAMKDEAPPWPGVLPMAESFVRLTTDWLRGAGSHVLTIPDFDYGVAITSPMGRRTLSFGGATSGPTVAGRLSGYYVLTPLEDRLSPEERASRIRSYNPYWTHVISYHEWLGHTVQRAVAEQNVTRPIRQAYGSSYLSQAWSFYLEKLLEDEGYFTGVLDHQTALKTRMGRLQMRMWRVQRIRTKLLMAKGEMTFDEAVRAYVERIGMEPANAFIEVQRDSQTPSPPGREIIGERVILELREEYARRMGAHHSLRRFHDTLLSHGALPFAVIRRLMFRG
jgi:uncharacterized protein (DUF885 family)